MVTPPLSNVLYAVVHISRQVSRPGLPHPPSGCSGGGGWSICQAALSSFGHRLIFSMRLIPEPSNCVNRTVRLGTQSVVTWCSGFSGVHSLRGEKTLGSNVAWGRTSSTCQPEILPTHRETFSESQHGDEARLQPGFSVCAPHILSWTKAKVQTDLNFQGPGVLSSRFTSGHIGSAVYNTTRRRTGIRKPIPQPQFSETRFFRRPGQRQASTIDKCGLPA